MATEKGYYKVKAGYQNTNDKRVPIVMGKIQEQRGATVVRIAKNEKSILDSGAITRNGPRIFMTEYK